MRAKHTEGPSFDVRKDEALVISQIAARAWTMFGKRTKWKALDFNMDIIACHANGCPLKLHSLLEADDFNFTHDVLGIRANLNRETGKLENHFYPRFHAENAA